MIKLQDFARQQGVTDRAIQKHLKKYAAELEGHIEKKGPNGTWLDDEACKILRSKMIIRPASLVDPKIESKLQQQELRIRELEEQLRQKEQYIYGIEASNIKKQQQIDSLIEEKKLIEDKSSNLEVDLRVTQEELNSFKPWLFGLYKKK